MADANAQPAPMGARICTISAITKIGTYRLNRRIRKTRSGLLITKPTASRDRRHQHFAKLGGLTPRPAILFPARDQRQQAPPSPRERRDDCFMRYSGFASHLFVCFAPISARPRGCHGCPGYDTLVLPVHRDAHEHAKRVKSSKPETSLVLAKAVQRDCDLCAGHAAGAAGGGREPVSAGIAPRRSFALAALFA
jgi:hypothetical protein